MFCRELKAAKEKLRRLQELVMRIQQGAGFDALMELESVMSATESVDAAPAAAAAAAATERLLRMMLDAVSYTHLTLPTIYSV